MRSDAARARAIEPLNAYAVSGDFGVRLAAGNFWGAMATVDTLERIDPLSPLVPWFRLFIYNATGMRDSMQAVWQRFPAPLRKGSFGDVFEQPSPKRVVALARLGRTAEALPQLKIVEQAFGKRCTHRRRQLGRRRCPLSLGAGVRRPDRGPARGTVGAEVVRLDAAPLRRPQRHSTRLTPVGSWVPTAGSCCWSAHRRCARRIST